MAYGIETYVPRHHKATFSLNGIAAAGADDSITVTVSTTFVSDSLVIDDLPSDTVNIGQQIAAFLNEEMFLQAIATSTGATNSTISCYTYGEPPDLTISLSGDTGTLVVSAVTDSEGSLITGFTTERGRPQRVVADIRVSPPSGGNGTVTTTISDFDEDYGEFFMYPDPALNLAANTVAVFPILTWNNTTKVMTARWSSNDRTNNANSGETWTTSEQPARIICWADGGDDTDSFSGYGFYVNSPLETHFLTLNSYSQTGGFNNAIYHAQRASLAVGDSEQLAGSSLEIRRGEQMINTNDNIADGDTEIVANSGAITMAAPVPVYARGATSLDTDRDTVPIPPLADARLKMICWSTTISRGNPDGTYSTGAFVNINPYLIQPSFNNNNNLYLGTSAVWNRTKGSYNLPVTFGPQAWSGNGITSSIRLDSDTGAPSTYTLYEAFYRGYIKWSYVVTTPTIILAHNFGTREFAYNASDANRPAGNWPAAGRLLSVDTEGEKAYAWICGELDISPNNGFAAFGITNPNYFQRRALNALQTATHGAIGPQSLGTMPISVLDEIIMINHGDEQILFGDSDAFDGSVPGVLPQAGNNDPLPGDSERRFVVTDSTLTGWSFFYKDVNVASRVTITNPSDTEWSVVLLDNEQTQFESMEAVKNGININDSDDNPEDYDYFAKVSADSNKVIVNAIASGASGNNWRATVDNTTAIASRRGSASLASSKTSDAITVNDTNRCLGIAAQGEITTTVSDFYSDPVPSYGPAARAYDTREGVSIIVPKFETSAGMLRSNPATGVGLGIHGQPITFDAAGNVIATPATSSDKNVAIAAPRRKFAGTLDSGYGILVLDTDSEATFTDQDQYPQIVDSLHFSNLYDLIGLTFGGNHSFYHEYIDSDKIGYIFTVDCWQSAHLMTRFNQFSYWRDYYPVVRRVSHYESRIEWAWTGTNIPYSTRAGAGDTHQQFLGGAVAGSIVVLRMP